MRIEETGSAGRVVLGALLCGFVALVLACQAPERPRVSDEAEPSTEQMTERADEGAVISAHRALIRALEEANADSVRALLEPKQSLLIFHPFLENRFDGYEEVGEGIGRMLARHTPLEWTEVHQSLQIEGDVAWLTSHVVVKSPALESPFVGRGPEIWVRTYDEWRLIHGHWSEHARLAGATSEE
jgi:ketosteroid isomerase-like protein